MRYPQPSLYNSSIVFVGNFNPKIFHPAWFAAEGLIGKQESDGATIEIIHPDIAIFSLGWVRIEVLRGRFKAETRQQPYDEAMRDLVVSIFTLLRHTPLTQMGINLEIHLRMDSFDQWNAAGHKLAPKELWEGQLQAPGMRSITMEEAVRRDGRKGRISVIIEPSVKIEHGLYMAVNDHIVLSDQDSETGSDEMITALKEIWAESHKRSEDIIYTIFERLSK